MNDITPGAEDKSISLEQFYEGLAQVVGEIRTGRGDHAPSGDLLSVGFWMQDSSVNVKTPYVVKGIFGKGQLVVFWGAPGSGKSFVALEMAAAIGTGERWRGRRTRKGVVVYLSAESSRPYIENRVAALKQEWPAVAKADVFIIALGLDLLHAGNGDADKLTGTVQQLTREIGEVVLVVIDTLAVTFGGGKENAPEDMSAYVATIKRLIEDTGAAVLLIHHSGKDEAKGMRGHSALLGAIDAELAIDAAQQGGQAHQRILRSGKVREGDGFTDLFLFTLRRVELGTDADGDPVTTCVVDGLPESELAKARRSAKGLGKTQRMVVDLLEKAGSMTRPDAVKMLGEDYGLSKSAAQHAISALLLRDAIRNPHGLLTLD
jgi:KaiC/GvpD/RAD55 family RecA-like ATPase